MTARLINRSALIVAVATTAFLLTNCEDPIEVPSQFEAPQLVIDAWLTDVPDQPQTIRLSETVPYFAGGEPKQIEGATVAVCRDNGATCFDFVDTGRGNYVWTPAAGESLGQVGDVFTLQMEVDGANYTSTTGLARTAVIDSISVFFEPESIFTPEGLYGELFARDQPGRGDTYWIRSYRNDTLLNRPNEITVVFDATFDAGANIDGVYFISPIRTSINRVNDEFQPIPYQPGDRIYVEVHSINRTAYDFLNIATEQIQNEGIFAVPIANAPGNVVNEATGETILGIFNVAAVASAERMVTE
jgi:hypothetical protein